MPVSQNEVLQKNIFEIILLFLFAEEPEEWKNW